MASKRQFKLTKGERGAVPVWVGICSPSGGGKTCSALRVATGIKEVFGGSIAVIDTEARRALHFNDLFEFEHLDLRPPFGSVDYLAAVQYCRDQGHRNIVIDSLSHEHAGPGGLLDFHDSETERLADLWQVKRDVAQLAGWQKPKKARNLLIGTMAQMEGNFICCFRAKATTKPVKKKDGKTEMVHQGFMPVTGDEWPFEMTVNILLPPHSGGVPQWDSEYAGEMMMMKLPGHLEHIFKPPRQLDEQIGRELAEWARSGAKPTPTDPPQPDPIRKELDEGLVEIPRLLGEIKQAFRQAGLAGQSEEEKAERLACLMDAFGSGTWAEIEQMSNDVLERGLARLREILKI